MTTRPEENFPARLEQVAGTGDSGARLRHGPSAIHCAGHESPERREPGDSTQVERLTAPVWEAGNYLWRGLWVGWRFLRQVSGDDAYERYVQHVARFHPEQTPMSRAEHFRFRQEQKWNRVSRCC